MAEIPLLGSSPGIPQADVRAVSSRSSVSSGVDVSLPKVDHLSKSIQGLTRNLGDLQKRMHEMAMSGDATKLGAQFDKLDKMTAGLLNRGGGTPYGLGFGGAQATVWQLPNVSTSTKLAPPTMAGVPAPAAPGGTPGDIAGGKGLGQGAASAMGNFMSNLTGQNGLMAAITAPITGLSQMWGSLAGGSLQYVYNRVNGPTGNMNQMMRLAQALAPNSTMMGAATGRNVTIQDVVQGLAQRAPIMGTQEDMLQTIQAGQSVGALMAGTPGRNGFFESARQMQVLNPGQAPGQIAGGLAGYIGNVGSQKMGAMFGEGAFTMIGAGGRYRTLAEWAEGITKFFEQHRPGGAQGKSFSPDELIAQNFPGSNINAWFQFMGIPQQMVDYWWQYVLTNSKGKPASEITSETLQKMTSKDRGVNLGFEQLRSATQSTRRDYLFGNQMYGMYALNQAANRRFNVQMQGTDQALGHLLQTTNLGRMIALLPTPIQELLMPIFTQLFTSPVGAAGSALGGLFSMGDPQGDVMPYGDYGEKGGMTTAHLSPDLAKRVSAMMRSNPNLQISSGYRDTVTQNRLRRKGGPVAPASRSAHTRGWAVDIGPMSQAGWLQANAGRFGLQTAAGAGEPWHVQMAGSPMGDPMPYGDIFGSLKGLASTGINIVTDPLGAITGGLSGAASGLAEAVFKGLLKLITGAMSTIMDVMEEPMKKVIDKFISSGTFSDLIDHATNLFSKVITAPFSGIANLAGKGSPMDMSDLQGMVNQSAPSSVAVVGSGFTSAGSLGPDIFGDPFNPKDFPPPSMMMSTGQPIYIKADITLNGIGAGPNDARRAANVFVEHLDTAVSQRDWRRS